MKTDMTEKYKLTSEYLKLGRYLWERVNQSPLGTSDENYALGEIIDRLSYIYEDDDDGFMLYLSEWLADRRDTEETWQEYGDSIKADYPEFFAPPETTAERPAIPAAGREN